MAGKKAWGRLQVRDKWPWVGTVREQGIPWWGRAREQGKRVWPDRAQEQDRQA